MTEVKWTNGRTTPDEELESRVRNPIEFIAFTYSWGKGINLSLPSPSYRSIPRQTIALVGI